jgi:hypothetical protein
MLFAAPINMIFEIPPSAPDITENLFLFIQGDGGQGFSRLWAAADDSFVVFFHEKIQSS